MLTDEVVDILTQPVSLGMTEGGNLGRLKVVFHVHFSSFQV